MVIDSESVSHFLPPILVNILAFFAEWVSRFIDNSNKLIHAFEPKFRKTTHSTHRPHLLPATDRAGIEAYSKGKKCNVLSTATSSCIRTKISDVGKKLEG